MEVARAFNLRIETRELLRVRHRRPQTELDPKVREKNASGVFSYSPSKILASKTVILVDDVCTTGSTLDSCAKVLKEAGVQKVIGLVVAKG